MAFTYGFYNSLNGDRKYDARHISAIFDGIINDGVYASIGDILAPRPGDGMQVLVGSGRAWFNRTWNDNDADFPVNLPASDPLMYRYYAICVEVNSDVAARSNRIISVQGNLGSEASVIKPTLTKSELINQWALGYILVPPGVTQITQSMIEVVVGKSETPFVTGIIQTASIDALFQQWEGDFNAWWDNIKATLDENIVTNLQNQINERVKIADKATTDDAKAGTNDTKWMTPLKTLQAIEGNRETAIGDIKVSGKNLEIETDGKFLTCNGRTLMSAAYPDLFNAIGRRFGGSVSMVYRLTKHVTPSGSYDNWSTHCFAVSDSGEITTASYRYNNASSPTKYWTHITKFNADKNIIASYTLSSGSTFDIINQIFYIGDKCYGLGYYVPSSGNYTAKIWDLSGTTSPANPLWSQGVSSPFYCYGARIIGDTLYLLCAGPSVSIFSITNGSVMKTEIYQAGAGLVVLLDRTVYLGGPRKQTDLTVISLTDITNQTMNDFFDSNPGSVETQSRDGKHLICRKNSPLVYTELRLSDPRDEISFSTKAFINQTGNTAFNDGYPAIEKDGTVSLASYPNANRIVGFGTGNENSMNISKIVPVPFTSTGHYSTFTYFRWATDGMFVLPYLTNDTTMPLGYAFIKLADDQFNLPDSTSVIIGPNTWFIKAKD